MADTSDLVLKMLGDVNDSVNSLAGKVDKIGDSTSDVKTSIAGIVPRIDNLEKNRASDNEKHRNNLNYMRSLEKVILDKHDKLSDKILQKVDTRLNEVDELKKKVEQFNDINNKFDNWQQERNKEKFTEKVIRATIAAVTAILVWVYTKLPLIVKDFGL